MEDTQDSVSYDLRLAFYLIRNHTQSIKDILKIAQESVEPTKRRMFPEARIDFNFALRSVAKAFAQADLTDAQAVTEGIESAELELPCGKCKYPSSATDGVNFYLDQLRGLVQRKDKATVTEFMTLIEKLNRATELAVMMDSFPGRYRQDPDAICKTLDEIGSDIEAAINKGQKGA